MNTQQSSARHKSMTDKPTFSIAKRIRHRIEAWATLGLLKVLGWLPVDIASAIPGKLLRWLGPLTSRHKRALRNLERVMPNATKSQRKQIALAHWENMGRILGEMPHLKSIFNDPSRFSIENDDVVKAIANNKKGCVNLCGHIGNWELAAVAGNLHNKRQFNFYKTVTNPHLDKALAAIRVSNMDDGEMVAKGGRGLRRGMQAVKDGNIVGMMVDLREDDGIEVPFLGIPAKTNQASALLALRYDAPIYAVVFMRQEGARFKAILKEIEVERTGDFKHDTLVTMENINRQYSTWIMENPKQWMWSHRRW